MSAIPILREQTDSPLAAATALVRSWRYAGGKRDLRLDLLRGFAAFAMIVDHVGGQRSLLYPLTGGNRFFVSAAELFVFISGLTVGIVYGGLIVRQGLGAAVLKALRRAWTLYLLTLLLTFTFAAISLVLVLPWAPRLTPESAPGWALGVVLLQRTYFLADVMLLYAVLLLAAAPLLVALAHGQVRWVLAGSWAVWALWQVAPEQAQIPWAIRDNTVFNIAAWQVLFVSALAIGFHREAVERRLAAVSMPLIVAVTGALLAAAAALALTQERAGGLLAPGSAFWEQLHGKADVRPGRLLAFAVFFLFAYGLTTLLWTPLERATGRLLLPLGQDALWAYSLHLYVVAVLAWLLPTWTQTRGETANTLIQVLGVVVIWSMIVTRSRILAKARSLLRRRRARRVIGDAGAPRSGGTEQDGAQRIAVAAVAADAASRRNRRAHRGGAGAVRGRRAARRGTLLRESSRSCRRRRRWSAAHCRQDRDAEYREPHAGAEPAVSGLSPAGI